MKSPLQSAPIAARPGDPPTKSKNNHNHNHSSSIGSLFQGLTKHLRSDHPPHNQHQATTANSFHIVHFPDRPLIPVQPSQAPSEDECRLLLQRQQPARQEVSFYTLHSRYMAPVREKKGPVSAQAQLTAHSSREARRPQTSHSAAPPWPSTSSRPLPPLPLDASSSSPSRPQTATTAPRVSVSAATKMRHERQARLAETIPAAQPSWSAPRASSRPSVRSNASNTSTAATSSSGSSVMSTSTSVRRGSSSGSNRSGSQPARSARTPSAIQTGNGVSRNPASRPLPPIPASPIQQNPPRQAHPPPGPLSSRPPLHIQPKVQTPNMATFAQRMATAQFNSSPGLPPPITAPPLLLSNEQVLPPRRFHMDGQTYDDALAPLQKQKTEATQRPSSSSSTCARIGRWTENESGHRTDDENGIDISQLISSGPQRRPRRACLSLDCNGDCSDCSPTILSYNASGLRQQESKPKTPSPSLPAPSPPTPSSLHPKVQAPHQQQRRNQPVSRPAPRPSQHQTRCSQLRQSSDSYEPRISSPLRNAHPASPQKQQPPSPQLQARHPSPRPNSADVSPLTPPPRSPLRDDTLREETMSPVSFTMPIISVAEPVGDQTSAYDTEDPAIAKALREAEEENGGPLLPWDIEVIKASMERGPRPRHAPAPAQPPRFVDWHKDPNANRAASESSSTALAILLKTLSSMPKNAQQKMGIVGIGSVGHKRPQPEPPATITTVDATAYNSLSQRGAICDDDSSGDYTTSWPESSYYFEKRGPVVERQASVQVHSARSGVRSNGTSQARASAQRQRQRPYIQQAADVRHPHQL